MYNYYNNIVNLYPKFGVCKFKSKYINKYEILG